MFAPPVAAKEPPQWRSGEPAPAGAEGLPPAPAVADQAPAPPFPTATMGPFRWLLKLLRQYWFNSAIAVGLMLAFALTGGQAALWDIFATSNQLLAAIVLLLAALWLLRRKRKLWFAFIPAVLMLATTATKLVLMLLKFLQTPRENATLLAADIMIMAITAYLLVAGVRAAARHFGKGRSVQAD